MGLRRTAATAAAGTAARRVAPVAAGAAVRQFLSRAIDGIATFPGAVETAVKQLTRTRDVDRAVKGVIEQHVRLAGAQGFVTNLGGLLALPLTLPANVTGLAMLQVRMVAAIAHLRGYDVDDPRVRAACLALALGPDEVAKAVESGDLPGTPYDIATGRVSVDPAALDRLTSMVAANLLSRVGGKKVTLTIVRRIPMAGGIAAAGMDGFLTYGVGRYGDVELRPRMVVTQDVADGPR